MGQTDPQPRYRLTVTNQGTYQTFGTITVRDKLPSGITASSGTYDGWDCTVSDQDVTCTSPANPADFSVGVGESSTFELPVTIGPTASGSITNTASTGGGGDPANGGQAPDPANCSSGDASGPADAAGVATRHRAAESPGRTPSIVPEFAMTASGRGG